MEKANPTFEAQIQRLKAAYGERAYPEERTALFLRALGKTPDHILVEAVDELIANHRSAPMLKELSDAVDRVRGLDAERRSEWARADAWKRNRQGFVGVMMDAAERSGSEYGKTCVGLLTSFLDRKMSAADFEANIAMLDSASPTKCPRCKDRGLVFEGGVHRCSCLKGQQIPERSYAAARADGAREVIIIPTVSSQK